MARPVAFEVSMTVRLPRSIVPAIDEVLKGGEIRSRFIRTAVMNEVERRKKDAAKRRAA